MNNKSLSTFHKNSKLTIIGQTRNFTKKNPIRLFNFSYINKLSPRKENEVLASNEI